MNIKRWMTVAVLAASAVLLVQNAFAQRAILEAAEASIAAEAAERQRQQAAKNAAEEAAYQRQEAVKEAAAQVAFSALLASKNQRQMYLSAVQLEDIGDKGKAKTVYRELMKRHPNGKEALLASQRLIRLSDVEAVESSNSRAASANYEATQSILKNNYQQCMNNRSACWESCRGTKKRIGVLTA